MATPPSSAAIAAPPKAPPGEPDGPTKGTGAPWRALLVGGVILALQVLLVDRLIGDDLLALSEPLFGRRFLRKEVLTAVLAAAVVLWQVARRNLDTFRNAPLDPTRLAAQAIPFFALLAFMATIPTDLPQSLVGTTGTTAIATVLTLAWIASPLLLLPPGGTSLRAGGAAAAAAGIVGGAIAFSEWFTDAFWLATGRFTVDAVEWLLGRIVGDGVVRPSTFEVGTERCPVKILSPCSGYQGIILITLLFTAYLWWFRAHHRFPRSLVIFPVGIVLVFLANILRITALILVGTYISPQIAIDGFHSQAGWIAFLVVGLGTIGIISRMPYFTLTDEETDASGTANLAAAAALCPAAGASAGTGTAVGAGAATGAATGAWFGPSVVACLLPYLALLATQILTGAFSVKGTLDILYPLRVVAVAAVLWRLRGELWPRSFAVSPVAIGIGAAVTAAWMALVPSFWEHDAAADAALDPMQLGPLWGPLWLAVRLVGYVVTVPIAEELAFRGFLTRRLVSEQVETVRPGTLTWVSFLASSLLFGVYHGATWLPATIAGAGFALALAHRGRIGDAIVAHATTNGLIALSVIATRAWSNFG